MGEGIGEPVPRLISRAAEGDAAAAAALTPLVYAELRALAAGYLRWERVNHTLQPTDLVHEAFLRLAGRVGRSTERSHFLALAAVAMRNVLVDHARRRRAAKRGGGAERWSVTLIMDEEALPDRHQGEVLELDDLLKRLALLDARRGKVVELKVFAGMTNEEIAEVLDVSRSTVSDDWTVAKAWLAAELRPKGQQKGGGP